MKNNLNKKDKKMVSLVVILFSSILMLVSLVGYFSISTYKDKSRPIGRFIEISDVDIEIAQQVEDFSI